MSAMGIKIDQFEMPICYSFQAKILNDQLCYEVDLDRFADKNNPSKDLKLGFNFLMDYNEARQVILPLREGKVQTSKLAWSAVS